MNKYYKWASELLSRELHEGIFDRQRYEDFCRSYYGFNNFEISMIEKGVVMDIEELVQNSLDAMKRKEKTKEARELSKMELSNFGKGSVNEYGDVKTALNLARKFNKTMDNYKKQSIDSRILKDMGENLTESIIDLYHQGAQSYIKEATEWQDRFAKLWKEKSYDDPQQEMLKRQDIDTRLSGMNKHDLANYILNKHYQNDNLDEYGINRLLAVTKDNSELHSNVKAFKEANHIGSEYEKSEEWQNVANNISTAKLYASLDHVLGAYGENDPDNFIFTKAETGRCLSDYDLQSPKQWREYSESQQKQNEAKNKIENMVTSSENEQ